MTAEKILNVFDEVPGLPWLDTDLFIIADARLTVFRSAMHWAVAVEVSAYWPDLTDDLRYALCTHAHFVGNCLSRGRGGIQSEATACPVESEPDDPLLVLPPGHPKAYVSPTARTLRLRRAVIPVPGAEEYAAAGVQLRDPPTIYPEELLRCLCHHHRELLLLTERELRRGIVEELPILLRLDSWHHPDLRRGEVASDMETFRMLAKVIASGDVREYRPTEPPNTHWSNWPLAGWI